MSTSTLERAGLVDPADLVNINEISRRAGKSRTTVYHWRHDHHLYPGFPEPLVQDGQWLVFLWSEVEAWIERTYGTADRPVCVEDLDEL